jgi:hypothetical protein
MDIEQMPAASQLLNDQMYLPFQKLLSNKFVYSALRNTNRQPTKWCLMRKKYFLEFPLQGKMRSLSRFWDQDAMYS